MSIDGNWEFIIDSPIGRQPLWVEFSTDGEKVKGTARADGQVIDPDIIDGELNGDILTFKVKSRKPVPLTMKMNLAINGDKASGKVKPGMFGNFPVTGKRI